MSHSHIYSEVACVRLPISNEPTKPARLKGFIHTKAQSQVELKTYIFMLFKKESEQDTAVTCCNHMMNFGLQINLPR